MFDLKTYLETSRRTVEAALDKALPPAQETPCVLHKAMRYSVLSGGKRIRPALCLTAAEIVGGKQKDALPPAVAIELLHTYTLIHDDLPCMDDDVLRRGKPTCHVKFGEANALLAGDALQALAFEILAYAKVPSRYPPNQLVLELATAAGSRGVVGGQVEDLAFVANLQRSRRKPKAATVQFIHMHKTADLFRAALRMGGIVGNADKDELSALAEFGVCLGLAFQLTDDLLDANPTQAKRGNHISNAEEMTCLSIYSPDEARRRARRLTARGTRAIERIWGNAAHPLVAICESLVDRVS